MNQGLFQTRLLLLVAAVLVYVWLWRWCQKDHSDVLVLLMNACKWYFFRFKGWTVLWESICITCSSPEILIWLKLVSSIKVVISRAVVCNDVLFIPSPAKVVYFKRMSVKMSPLILSVSDSCCLSGAVCAVIAAASHYLSGPGKCKTTGPQIYSFYVLLFNVDVYFLIPVMFLWCLVYIFFYFL